MKPYYEDGSVVILHGDCREVLPGLAPCETCITDPPYGLSFMGNGWDHGVPGEQFWRLIADALLPGASCLAFGGTRTHHRLMVAMEDAGLEIRDCMMWLYGSGFPKALDISKAIDKAAGADREVTGVREYAGGHIQRSSFDKLAPPIGTFVRTQDERATSAPATDAARLWHGWGTALKPAWEPIVLAMKPLAGTFAENALTHGVAGLNIDAARIPTEPEALGRWPANVVLDEDAARLLNEQSGTLQSGYMRAGTKRAAQDCPGSVCYGTYGGGATASDTPGDSGGASRFFYTGKASRADRGEGNTHPTVKPSDLMAWLCRLTATPTGGTVLDPFMGSGTTLYAAKETGRKAVGIEIEERYCAIAAKRCSQGVLDLGAAP